jgi:type III secretory pathway component EscU
MFIVMTKTSFIDYMKNILKVNKIQNKTPYSQASRKLHIRLCSFTISALVPYLPGSIIIVLWGSLAVKFWSGDNMEKYK